MYTKLTIKNTDLPSPTKISVTKEQLWNSKTGRSVKTGKMLGAVVGEKRTLDVEWTMLTASEFDIVISALSQGFFGPVFWQTSNSNVIEMMAEAYHGPITYVEKGYVGSTRYYESVKTTLIER